MSRLDPHIRTGAIVNLWKESDNYQQHELTGSDGIAWFDLPSNLTEGWMYLTSSRYDASTRCCSLYVTEGGDLLSSDVQSSKSKLLRPEHLAVSPSCTRGSFQIRVPAFAAAVAVFDAQGVEIRHVPVAGNSSTSDVVVAGLPAGLYFVRASGEGRSETRKVLVVR